MGTTSVSDGAQCRQLCQDRPGCEFFTHYSDTEACDLVSSCDILDETCDGYCVHGRKNCDGIHEEVGRNA